ncbi:hypothetical protein V5799_008051 [Amblyomma americanum]|uniref:Ionotropic glutamate receptor C-terminal domain-containing protein n=1 Tax=Amblyomma americanum TaxID=6943 RepID=A0AAQ4FEH1_AMBAM
MHLRWIYLAQKRNATLPEKAMSKIFQRVGCRAVIVTTTAAYVPLDTYAGCSSGVRPLAGPGDNPFGDRSLGNLTTLRNIWETNLRTRKDWRKSYLEPQSTIVRNILRKSGASISDGEDFERFGSANEHSLFTGAVGAIQTKQRDLGSFEIYLTETIWHAVDVAGQVRYDALMFLSPLPTAITDLAIIGRPFTLSLWISVWASLFIYLVLLVVIIMTHSDTEQPPETSGEAVDLFFYLCSALVNHAPALRLPKRSSARILVGFWFLFAIVMSAGFKAMLTSYTNFPPKTRPIKTLEQLSRAVDNGSIKLCSVSNRYIRNVVTYHLSRQSGVLRERLEDALQDVQCGDALCCLAKVAAGTHVFFTNREEARLHTGRTFRGAVRADEDFVLVHVVMIAPRSSPYARAFAQVAQRFFETGVSAFSLKLQKFRHIRSTATWKAKVNRGKQGSFRVLQLKDLYGMVVVWCFGLALALCVLLCEVVCGTQWKSGVGKSETRKVRAHRKEKKEIAGSQSRPPSKLVPSSDGISSAQKLFLHVLCLNVLSH